MPWAPPPPNPVHKLSEMPRVRGHQQRRLMDAGLHPLMATPIRPLETRRCGGCRFAVRRGGRASYGRGWWKCEQNETADARSDLTKSWPACELFEEKTE